MAKRRLYSLKENWVKNRYQIAPTSLRVLSGEGIFPEVLRDVRGYDLRQVNKGVGIPIIEVYHSYDDNGRCIYSVREGINTVRAFLAFKEGAEMVPVRTVPNKEGMSKVHKAEALASVGIYNIGDLERVLKERE